MNKRYTTTFIRSCDKVVCQFFFVAVLIFAAGNLKAQYCVKPESLEPPNYIRLMDYLKRNNTPCPNTTRSQWASAQFYRIGRRIEELHKAKPREASALMQEYNLKLEPYIVSQSYTGFENDQDFRNCINFMYKVDLAIDRIKTSN